jgi:alpha-1,3-rhamnosyltransferase
MTSNSGSSTAKRPLVTVVMPCYNHEDYVERAVRSVIDQTYPHLQLIVIDDGSTDESGKQLEALQKQLRFHLIRQENRGVCRALNRAIQESAQGEYIALLASDDFWHREKLQMQIAELERHPQSAFCFSQAIAFKDDNNPNDGRIFPRRCLSGHILERVFVRQHVPAGTMVFTRKLYNQLGGFDESLIEEDWDFVIRSAAATPFCAVDSPLLYYRCHNGSTMLTRKRALIFQQKARILAKNFHLVPSATWLTALLLHFSHDIIYCRKLKRSCKPSN